MLEKITIESQEKKLILTVIPTIFLNGIRDKCLWYFPNMCQALCTVDYTLNKTHIDHVSHICVHIFCKSIGRHLFKKID